MVRHGKCLFATMLLNSGVRTAKSRDRKGWKGSFKVKLMIIK